MNIGIVGAGILGRLLAFALVNKGYQITLFDRDDIQGNQSCSMAASGLLAPYTELDKSAPIIFHMGLEAVTHYWPNIISELSANEIYFRENGTLLVAHPKEQQELAYLGKIIQAKLPEKNAYQILNKNETQQLEAQLTPFETSYFFAQEAHLDNQNFFNALTRFLIAKKVIMRMHTEVLETLPGKIKLAQGTENFDWVFDCRGLGAKALFNNLRGVRGELLWLYAPEVTLTRPIRLIHPKYSIYLIPRPQHTYLVGASEIESESMDPISVRTSLELLSAVYYLHAGFIEARIIKSVVNCRPTLTNHLPQIKYAPGLIAINGLYRHGFLLAPVLINEVMTFLFDDKQAIRYPTLWEKFT